MAVSETHLTWQGSIMADGVKVGVASTGGAAMLRIAWQGEEDIEELALILSGSQLRRLRDIANAALLDMGEPF